MTADQGSNTGPLDHRLGRMMLTSQKPRCREGASTCTRAFYVGEASETLAQQSLGLLLELARHLLAGEGSGALSGSARHPLTQCFVACQQRCVPL
jgi:hypothetical protein